jgi:membrane fusion protein, multidrug efflux system
VVTSYPRRRHPDALIRIQLTTALVISASLLLGACSKPAQKIEEVRPVRAMTLTTEHADVVAEFPGEVRPQIESRLGFRVGGKIIARKVDAGTAVKRGQVLMQLDPQDLQLAQSQSNAALRAAESNRDLARADFKRYQELREKNFVSQAVLDSKETAFKAAQATYEQAMAGYRNQSNQAGYATLIADVDGVVTGVDAEVGQVVAPGAPVVRVAKLGARDVVVGIPEDKVEAVRRIEDVRVRIWANPKGELAGKLRELSPIADPATRTYTAKISIADAPPEVKLGMTAYVSFVAKTSNPMIRVPLTALFQDKGATSLWVVDKGVVKLVPVQVAGPAGTDILIARGVSPGQTVVTAGVNLLKPGQKVTILGNEPAGKDGNTGLAETAPHNVAAASQAASVDLINTHFAADAAASGAAK